MRRRLVVAICAVLLVVGLPGIAGATNDNTDGNRGNHEAIWSHSTHGSLQSGSEWGVAASTWARTEHKGGVSAGVHEAKGNGKG